MKIFNQNWFYYLAAIFLCLGIFFILAQDHNFFSPYYYAGDAIPIGVMVKGIIDSGWYMYNPFVGAPFGMETYDFAQPENFSYFVIKIISLFFPSYPVTLNIYYILTYVLVVCTSLYVMRYFNISYWSAIVGSLLFAYLPYHWLRGESHLFLSSYYTIPLIVLVLFWSWKKEWTKKRILASIVICALVASSGAYYAFFACFLLSFVLIYILFETKRLKNLIMPISLLLILVIGSLINLLPTILYTLENGKNNVSAVRDFGDTEIYPLKITNLLLPTDSHRIEILAKVKEKYLSGTKINEENHGSTLGIFGSIGFIISLFYLFSNKLNDIKRLSYLTISSVLLGTVGGIGTLFAFLVIPDIRAVNRISIFIAFFALVITFVMFDKVTEKRKVIYSVALPLILVVGIYDQTTNSFIPGNSEIAFKNDGDFIRQIESQLPKDSMVFQLPYVPYPEAGRLNEMTDYEHFKAYLHSTTTRWSYGAMKGRFADAWIYNMANKNTSELVSDLALAGFNGIYVNRTGYEDKGVRLEEELQQIIGMKPLENIDKTIAFYNLVEYAKKLEESVPDWEKKRYDLLHPLLISWTNGFSGLEGQPGDSWRWSDKSGELIITNTSDKVKQISLHFTMSTAYPENSNIVMSGLINDVVQVNNSGTEIIKNISVDPGKWSIKFETNAKKVDAPNDSRSLYFRVNNFEMLE